MSKFTEQFTDESTKICMLNLQRMHLDQTQTGLDRQGNASQVQCLKPTPILQSDKTLPLNNMRMSYRIQFTLTFTNYTSKIEEVERKKSLK